MSLVYKFYIDGEEYNPINMGGFTIEDTRERESGSYQYVRSINGTVHFDDKNICQPDVLFISNERKGILRDYAFGAPDFVMEILSPGTKKKDETVKMKIYGHHGVREYWIIDPYKETLKIYENKNNKMESFKEFSKSAKVQSLTVEGFSFELSEIFED